MVANNFATSPRRAENMFPSNPRRVYDSYRYDWQQQNSSRGMASAMEVPLRDATPSVVPSLHFPRNYYGSSPPALPDITSHSEESMVANNFATSPRRAENMFPANPRRMYDPYRYNWQQENSSRGMASPIEVPLRDATPSVVPLHFPHESSPPALVDITTQSEESMVANDFATSLREAENMLPPKHLFNPLRRTDT